MIDTPIINFTDSTDLLKNADAGCLQARADEEGYLFFRRLLPEQSLREARADLLSVVEKYGWRKPGQDRFGGLIDGDAINRVPDSRMRPDIGVSAQAYDDVQRLESMHRLPHHPNLLRMYRLVLGEDALVHPRHIVRMMTPHRSLTPTPEHQDFPLIQGTVNTWTCWFPVGACPRELGSLMVLQGSHKEGCLPIRQAPGAGGIAAQLCENETSWISGDFAEGDVLVFSSYTVHKALPHHAGDQIRLSMDIRFQATCDVVEEKSLLSHCGLPWDEIYRDWESDELQYYWRKLPIRFSSWNSDLLLPGRRIC